jgi:hypothetical protein
VRVIVVRTIIIIVPFVTSFTFDVISFLAPVFNSVEHISATDNITQVPVVLVLFSTVLLQGSDVAGRVSAWALAVVRILTLTPVSMCKGRVNHGRCVQHCLEALDLRIDLLAIFRQQGGKLINDHPRNQGILRRSAVDLFSLVFNLVKFITDRP